MGKEIKTEPIHVAYGKYQQDLVRGKEVRGYRWRSDIFEWYGKLGRDRSDPAKLAEAVAKRYRLKGPFIGNGDRVVELLAEDLVFLYHQVRPDAEARVLRATVDLIPKLRAHLGKLLKAIESTPYRPELPDESIRLAQYVYGWKLKGDLYKWVQGQVEGQENQRRKVWQRPTDRFEIAGLNVRNIPSLKSIGENFKRWLNSAAFKRISVPWRRDLAHRFTAYYQYYPYQLPPSKRQSVDLRTQLPGIIASFKYEANCQPRDVLLKKIIGLLNWLYDHPELEVIFYGFRNRLVRPFFYSPKDPSLRLFALSILEPLQSMHERGYQLPKGIRILESSKFIQLFRNEGFMDNVRMFYTQLSDTIYIDAANITNRRSGKAKTPKYSFFHELGHRIAQKYPLRQHGFALRFLLVGSHALLTDYDGSSLSKLGSNIPSAYIGLLSLAPRNQPTEDFAETFATYHNRRGRSRYKTEFADDLLWSYKGLLKGLSDFKYTLKARNEEGKLVKKITYRVPLSKHIRGFEVRLSKDRSISLADHIISGKKWIEPKHISLMPTEDEIKTVREALKYAKKGNTGIVTILWDRTQPLRYRVLIMSTIRRSVTLQEAFIEQFLEDPKLLTDETH